jgi:hypothetical protein
VSGREVLAAILARSGVETSATEAVSEARVWDPQAPLPARRPQPRPALVDDDPVLHLHEPGLSR